jgi:hypothetical protein
MIMSLTTEATPVDVSKVAEILAAVIAVAPAAPSVGSVAGANDDEACMMMEGEVYKRSYWLGQVNHRRLRSTGTLLQYWKASESSSK